MRQVPLHDVDFCCYSFLAGLTRLLDRFLALFPVSDVLEIGEKKDSFALGSTGRFHDPNGSCLPLKFFNEHVILGLAKNKAF